MHKGSNASHEYFYLPLKQEFHLPSTTLPSLSVLQALMKSEPLA
jgi:hypothetical protein